MTDHCVGIDLGTTYSCLAYIDEDGNPVVEKNYEQGETTPSVILFNENGEIVVGNSAKDQALMYPSERVITAIKRSMGQDYSVTIDGNSYNPTQLSAMILRKLIGDFEENHGCTLERAVITVPAYFGENQKDQTKTAGIIAGLKEVYLINEPTAAAIAFGYGEPKDKKERVLVYDLGGGTFDVTVLEIDRGEFSTVATDGAMYLGGKDWDADLTDIILEKVAEESGTDKNALKEDPDIMQTLAYDSETIKKRLSTAENTKGTLTVDGHKYVFNINRDEFESRSEANLLQTIDIIHRVLESKSFTMDDIDEIILVGGSSRMPQVKNAIAANFPGKDIKIYDPDQSVAKGASLYARSLMITDLEARGEAPAIGEGDEPPRKVTIKNVLSKTFGIKAIYEDGSEKISNLIFRNETLPITKTKIYYPVEDDQSSIKVEIFESAALNNEEGHKTDTDDGTPIGDFTMELPPGTSKNTPIEVTFIATEEGILTADVKCEDESKEYKLHNDLTMTEEEISKSQSLMEKVIRSE